MLWQLVFGENYQIILSLYTLIALKLINSILLIGDTTEVLCTLESRTALFPSSKMNSSRNDPEILVIGMYCSEFLKPTHLVCVFLVALLSYSSLDFLVSCCNANIALFHFRLNSVIGRSRGAEAKGRLLDGECSIATDTMRCLRVCEAIINVWYFRYSSPITTVYHNQYQSV